MWIAFLIPKIEDGNNFGVSIQEDTLAEIRTVESEAAAFFDQISRYFITRGKIVTKVYLDVAYSDTSAYFCSVLHRSPNTPMLRISALQSKSSMRRNMSV